MPQVRRCSSSALYAIVALKTMVLLCARDAEEGCKQDNFEGAAMDQTKGHAPIKGQHLQGCSASSEVHMQAGMWRA
jgi:hypothetical protein